MSERKAAERKVGLARLWARAKQIVTTDPSGSDDDDHVVDEEAARVLAAQAGKLKGGLAKVAQLAAYDPGASLGRGRGASATARAVLGGLWDKAPAVAAGDIARVIEQDLGKPPQQLFAHWENVPLAAASLGQVHAAKLHDGTDVVVKVQYPGVAEALRTDLDDADFLRKLAGAEVGGALDDDALTALGDAVRRELDYRAEAAMQQRFCDAWAGHASVRVPRVIAELSSARVLTSVRARGASIVDTTHASPDVRRQAAAAIFAFAFGSPLAHGLLNADPNPGNFLVETEGDGHVVVSCLDFGCALEIPDDVREADLAVFHALLDEDAVKAAERFRMALAKTGLLRRADTLATTAHRDWERALARPLATVGDFHWTPAYASDFADATRRVLAAGGLQLPARLLLLWRQRLGVAAVIGMLDAHAPFRRVLLDLIGHGRKALR
ncbi:MAG: AarF/ABC1/UbiB kinase family protein [Deltaproteobacteria bacterium]|nr:AarF/ABC1/UbiB kinase family protein [Deltaproteobacteria bacterium]